MLNTTQLQWIEDRLRLNGFVTRNQCLQAYISRLGAHICTLEKKGYKFQAGYINTHNGKDYKYLWLKDGQTKMF